VSVVVKGFVITESLTTHQRCLGDTIKTSGEGFPAGRENDGADVVVDVSLVEQGGCLVHEAGLASMCLEVLGVECVQGKRTVDF
jgi:hypothetical protein